MKWTISLLELPNISLIMNVLQDEDEPDGLSGPSKDEIAHMMREQVNTIW